MGSERLRGLSEVTQSFAAWYMAGQGERDAQGMTLKEALRGTLRVSVVP